ncbi:MAG: hydroxymethylglutaryl-CoA lyase [Terriglobales bacterium]
MADEVKIIECPRDAWQGLSGQIPAQVKVQYLKALIAAGFKHIDAVSFVSPKTVPQMADSEEVLRRLDPPDDVEIIGIVMNEKGADRAIATEAVKTLGCVYSISETFLNKNQNQTCEEALEIIERLKQKADDAGLGVVVYISMAFGNPYGDHWDEEEVTTAVGLLADMDIHAISLADTVGVADVQQISRLVSTVRERDSKLELGVHMHSRKQDAAAKILAAYDAGCRRFDSAIGGLGGCPFAQDELVGNIPTEIVLQTLKTRGVDVSMKKSLDKVLALSEDIAAEHAVKI